MAVADTQLAAAILADSMHTIQDVTHGQEARAAARARLARFGDAAAEADPGQLLEFAFLLAAAGHQEEMARGIAAERLALTAVLIYADEHVWADHANAAAHRAVITITADHPRGGDAWVVRRTARCGNVVGSRRCRPAAGSSAPCERGEDRSPLGPRCLGQSANPTREGQTAVQEIAHLSGAGRRRAADMAARACRPW